MDERDADSLRDYLADRDTPCPACGYSLRALTSCACPECGLDLELRVALTEPRQAAWAAGLLGLGAWGGFHGLLLGYVAWQSLRGGGFGPNPPEIVLMVCSVVGASGAGAAWYLKRGRVRGLAPVLRWGFALLAWVMAGATGAAFFVLVD
ncbi:MAG: hypothetical protein AAFP26_14580 [Planctomycetota bacterium]